MFSCIFHIWRVNKHYKIPCINTLNCYFFNLFSKIKIPNDGWLFGKAHCNII